ncbi:non-ribosomal peptide synthetase [Photorhabdus asymbiotica]|uniref:non-ribosomal peptide synthetase n=1 Tax=Photorhabdus asymbiotica TaxID=291112 RepID=UPI003DA6FACD
MDILNRFSDSVNKFPDLIAIKEGKRRLTYRQLDAASDLVAKYLQENQFTEQLIGLHLKSSIELVICILGSIKAGNGYVCIDPTYPDNRKQFVAEKAELSLVITIEPVTFDINKAVCYSEILEQRDNLQQTIIRSTTYDLATVIFTSGSTGTPKGIMLRQANIVSFVGTFVDVSEQDCIAQFSSISFDAFVFELWVALSYGASMCIIDSETLLYKNRFYEAATKNKISMAFITTALINNGILDHFIGIASFRRLYFGGEAVQRNALIPVFNNLDFEVVHVYGPTETTVFCLKKTLNELGESIPLGKPFANATAILIDEQGEQITEAGVKGEILIGGAGVSRGYLDDPQLTNASFIKLEGKRYFKTSDLATLNEFGEFVFIGRKGNTVKLHGYRVDLNEVTYAIQAIEPNVIAETLLYYDDQENHYLVSFICHGKMSESEVSQALKQSLPDYMLPSQIIKIDAFPVNFNGKVDKGSLVKILDGFKAENSESESIEDRVLNIWRKVLGNRSVSYDDKYFEVGGNSVLLLKLKRELDKEFGIKIKMYDLFSNATVLDQANMLQLNMDLQRISSRSPVAVKEM